MYSDFVSKVERIVGEPLKLDSQSLDALHDSERPLDNPGPEMPVEEALKSIAELNTRRVFNTSHVGGAAFDDAFSEVVRLAKAVSGVNLDTECMNPLRLALLNAAKQYVGVRIKSSIWFGEASYSLTYAIQALIECGVMRDDDVDDLVAAVVDVPAVEHAHEITQQLSLMADILGPVAEQDEEIRYINIGASSIEHLQRMLLSHAPVALRYDSTARDGRPNSSVYQIVQDICYISKALSDAGAAVDDSIGKEIVSAVRDVIQAEAGSLRHDIDTFREGQHPVLQSALPEFIAALRDLKETCPLPFSAGDFGLLPEWFTWVLRNAVFVRLLYLGDAAALGVPLEKTQMADDLNAALDGNTPYSALQNEERLVEVSALALKAGIPLEASRLVPHLLTVIRKGHSIDTHCIPALAEHGMLPADEIGNALLESVNPQGALVKEVVKARPDLAERLLFGREVPDFFYLKDVLEHCTEISDKSGLRRLAEEALKTEAALWTA